MQMFLAFHFDADLTHSTSQAEVGIVFANITQSLERYKMQKFYLQQDAMS